MKHLTNDLPVILGLIVALLFVLSNTDVRAKDVIKDPNGRITGYVYHDKGQLRITDRNGRIQSYIKTSGRHRGDIRDVNGRKRGSVK